jgi:pimeloyl-ACP methyl ester carboxylesterase
VVVGMVFANGQARGEPAPSDPSPFAITTPNGIDEEDFVAVGGIKQWVTIRGSDRANPILLVIGGPQSDGPGSIMSPYIRTFQPWEKDFTVVQWDQRGTGKTFAAAGKTIGPDLTIDRLVQDGLELTDYLRRRLHKAKIVVMGIDFGSTVGVKMVMTRPAAFSAYVGAGQIVKPRAERERYAYEHLLELATAGRDETSLADLKVSGPDVFREPRDPARVAAFQRVYAKYRAPVPGNPMQLAAGTPHWSMNDFAAAQQAGPLNEEKLGRAWGETFDYDSLGPRIAVPVFIIQGSEDVIAPAPMAKAWLDGLRAPKKVFALVPGAGNHVIETHGAAFLALLDRHVRPIAVAGDRAYDNGSSR